MRKYKITRTVTPAECDWLDKPFVKDEFVYHYSGCTYGCISDDGIAVTREPNKPPFLEVPRNAVKEIAVKEID